MEIPARFARTSTVALIVLSFGSFVAAQGRPGEVTDVAAVQAAPIRIDNFGRVSATYFVVRSPKGATMPTWPRSA